MVLRWIKSSRSLVDWDYKCVEAATLPDGGIAIRDSKNPDAAWLRVPRVNALLFIHAAHELGQ